MDYIPSYNPNRPELDDSMLTDRLPVDQTKLIAWLEQAINYKAYLVSRIDFKGREGPVPKCVDNLLDELEELRAELTKAKELKAIRNGKQTFPPSILDVDDKKFL